MNIVAKYRHGSKDSIDKDMYYVVDKLPSFRECQLFCANKEENRNLITIDDGVVSSCFKGTIDEINNGLIRTYSLHGQNYPLLITYTVERDSLIKTIRVLRCLLSYCSRTLERELVKYALNSSSWKNKVSIAKQLHFNEYKNYGKNGSLLDVYKVFAFQIGQIYGLWNNLELYTKTEIFCYIPSFYPYLYRKEADIEYLIYMIDKFLNTCYYMEV